MKEWSSMRVMNFCIRHNYYNAGDARQYEKMLVYVRNHPNPGLKDVLLVCADIICHSSELDIYTTSQHTIRAMMEKEGFIR